MAGDDCGRPLQAQERAPATAESTMITGPDSRRSESGARTAGGGLTGPQTRCSCPGYGRTIKRHTSSGRGREHTHDQTSSTEPRTATSPLTRIGAIHALPKRVHASHIVVAAAANGTTDGDTCSMV
jgi:hypothetical protein